MAKEFEGRVSDDVDIAIKAIMDAIKDLPELRKMEAILVANALAYLAMRFACDQGYDAARNMFTEFLKIVDTFEKENRVN